MRHAPVDAAQAYQLEVRYGLDGRQGRARWAPYLGVASGGGSRQALRLGVTLTVGRRLDAGLELGQRQGAPGADPERAAQLRATLRQTLTAVTTGIVDANGLTSPGYTYQWILVNGTEADIAGENSSTYTLVDADRREPMRKMILGFAVAIMLMAASAQAQGAVWSATFTPGDVNGYAVGCRNGDDDAECSNPSILSDDEFTVDGVVYTVTEFYQTSGTNRIYFAGIRSAAHAPWTDIADELKIGSTSLDIGYAFLSQGQNRPLTWRLRWSGDPGLDDVLGGDSLTDGTSISVTLISGDLPPPPLTCEEGEEVADGVCVPINTAPTVANTIPNQTATAGTAFSYAFLANTFADTDPGDTLTYTATQSDDTALPSWLSFAAATRTFSGTPTAADVGTVSVKVTASDGHGGSVSDTFDIVVSAAANTLATGAPTITGTAQVGQTLTASTTGIADANGLTSPTYTYQWIRVDGTDEEDISGENSSTYILVDADLGTTLKVKVSFTDDASNSETLTSAATATVSAAANTLATGAPTITGTAQVGQTLTAATTAITDADGLTTPTYTYQWIRVATDNTETNISSATASTYTLVAADQGTTVKVTVSFTDDANNPETLTSAATATVSAAANTLATGAPTITGTAQVGQTLTAATTAIMDADGLTSVSYTYQWIRVATDNTETNISSATASTYTLVAADQGTTVKVTVSFTDDANNPETLTSAATATVSAAANTLATGAPTITGTAQVGQTLTAGTTAIMDADGLTSVSYTYQWIRVATDNTETNISSATASTYTLVAADQGTTVKVTVSFTDDANNPETRTSAATAAVAAAVTGTPEPEPFEVEIVGVPEVAVTGGSYELTVQSDEDSLVYAWRVDGGAIEPDDVQMVVWTAPETAGVARIHVDVTREDGAKAGQSAYVRVEVPEPEPEPVPALPLLGQLLLALGLAGAGAMRLVRAARRP